MQRENTISVHLRDLLDVYPEVNISGLGLFAIISKAAWIDKEQNVLYPPTKTLSIRPESATAIQFMAVLKEEIKDRTGAYELISDALSAHVTELKEAGTTKIEGIGAISSDVNRRLSLIDVHAQWGEGTSYLPVLEVYPITKPEGVIKAKVQSIILDDKDPEGVTEPASYQEVGKQSFIPLIVLAIGVLSFLWYLKECGTSTTKETSIMEESTGNHDPAHDTLTNVNAKYMAYLTPEVLEEGCKVVVGSYMDRVNAQNQLREIAAVGFVASISSNGDSYRVILTFDCNEYNLKDYLEIVKEEITPNAWYLSPNIKTEDL